MQMTITKEKKLQHIHKKLQHEKAPVNFEWTLKNTRIARWKNVAAIAVSKFVRRVLFWWQQIVETMYWWLHFKEQWWTWFIRLLFNRNYLPWVVPVKYSRLSALQRRIFGVCRCKIFTDLMPFLSPNQQCQNTEGMVAGRSKTRVHLVRRHDEILIFSKSKRIAFNLSEASDSRFSTHTEKSISQSTNPQFSL